MAVVDIGFVVSVAIPCVYSIMMAKSEHTDSQEEKKYA
jgi:hypothetical protein